MATLSFKKSSSSSKTKSKHEIMMFKCKKHPKHKQSPGVCSLCLREKLSRLSSTSTSSSSRAAALMGTYYSSSSSLSSYYSSSSSSASSCSSPMNADQGKHYFFSTFLSGWGGKNNKVLSKSRSLAFVPRIMKNKQGNNYETKNKQQYWIFSKFLKPRSKKIDEGLVHSKTQRQIIVTS